MVINFTGIQFPHESDFDLLLLYPDIWSLPHFQNKTSISCLYAIILPPIQVTKSVFYLTTTGSYILRLLPVPSDEYNHTIDSASFIWRQAETPVCSIQKIEGVQIDNCSD
jgi:hypothetical protein